MKPEHTPGPWHVDYTQGIMTQDGAPIAYVCDDYSDTPSPDARLIAAAPELLAALKMARLAIGEHYAPHDCYATGPLTGDHYLDLVVCPACAFIKLHDAAIAKAEGKA